MKKVLDFGAYYIESYLQESYGNLDQDLDQGWG
jgi:hypothetical protein